MCPPVILYRIGRWFHLNHMKPIGKCFSYINRFLFAVWIPSSAEIGKKFSLGYWGLGVVIHSNSIIGDNVTIAQNVTIGRNFGDIQVPRIGSDVYIGAGSIVFGEITIKDNVIIGANSVVNKNIDANCTVTGNPFVVIKTDREKTYQELK